MNIHFLQHVPFEGPAEIGAWADLRGHNAIVTRLYEGDLLPRLTHVDGLVIMGGPMSVYDTARYRWLSGEIAFASDAIRSGVKILGVCLGAQIIARACGAKIYRNRDKEIGWFPVSRKWLPDIPFPSDLPETLTVFHWHGETFDLPPTARLHFSSEGCVNQCFSAGSALALQFHLEMNSASIVGMIENCGNELSGAKYIQAIDEIRKGYERYGEENKRALVKILDGFFGCP